MMLFQTQSTRNYLTWLEIEWLMKAFKRHRCALEIDHSFVHSELKEVIEINNKT
jgi:hypothetical protein